MRFPVFLNAFRFLLRNLPPGGRMQPDHVVRGYRGGHNVYPETMPKGQVGDGTVGVVWHVFLLVPGLLVSPGPPPRATAASFCIYLPQNHLVQQTQKPPPSPGAKPCSSDIFPFCDMIESDRERERENRARKIWGAVAREYVPNMTNHKSMNENTNHQPGGERPWYCIKNPSHQPSSERANGRAREFFFCCACESLFSG
uniref:Putative secreted protein n=1 Tax=Anopheles triannulatus TaxID=58253 RepID=A0A2M4B543_9DIPT